MKPKFLVFILPIFFCIHLQSDAQGIFIGMNAGYGYGILNPHTNYEERIVDDESILEYKNIRYGSGLRVAGTIGYMISSTLGFDLGISNLRGAKSTIYTDRLELGFDGFQNQIFSAKLIVFNPSVLIKTDGELIHLYLKTGPAFGFSKLIEDYHHYEFGSLYHERTFIMDKGSTLGFCAGFGVGYLIKGRVSLTGEISVQNFVFTPDRKKLTKSVKGGINELEYMTVAQRETRFVQRLELNETHFGEPARELVLRIPITNIGVNFGIHYKL